jgi:hypothetical protein
VVILVLVDCGIWLSGIIADNQEKRHLSFDKCLPYNLTTKNQLPAIQY